MCTMPYAYLGPEGTFCQAALTAVDPGAESLSCPTIQAALAAVRGGAAERAVVPIESSVEGVVTATLDDLATGDGLVIVAELQIPIAFALLARPGTGLGDIKRVGGHPQAMPQCRGWLGANLPDCEWIPVASNAEAAPLAADGRLCRGHVRPRGSRRRRARPDQRGHPVRRGGAARPAARAHRVGPDVARGLHCRGSSARAA